MNLNLELLNEELSSIIGSLDHNNSIIRNTSDTICGEEVLSNKNELANDVPTPLPNGLIEELFRKVNAIKSGVNYNLNKIERINRSVYGGMDQMPNCASSR